MARITNNIEDTIEPIINRILEEKGLENQPRERKPLLVFYISTVDIPKERFREEIRYIAQTFTAQVHGEGYLPFFIPIDGDSRIECINTNCLTNDQYEDFQRKFKQMEETFYEFLDARNKLKNHEAE